MFLKLSLETVKCDLREVLLFASLNIVNVFNPVVCFLISISR